MSIEHSTFVIERTYAASPARVFQAWADPASKRHWFGEGLEMDFRVGGRETNGGGPEGGPHYSYAAEYRDIVPDERIVYWYEMHMDEQLISVSVATLELEPDGDGTRLTLTEHGAFLDGLDTSAQREHGTGVLLDRLGDSLAPAHA
jgi:uncharacterized protein YndB with AHSA1/START domain